MEEIIRLIENFSYDQMRAGKLDGKTSDFLFDLRTLIEDSKRSLKQEYERGKDDGWQEGYDGKEREQELKDDDNDSLVYGIEELVLRALSIDGSHHKQQYLNRIARLINPTHDSDNYE